MSEHAGTAFRRYHPRAIGPRRIVADVLVVAAREFGHPVLLFVEMETGDRLVHT
jgi:hypothetical protein